MMIHGCSLVSCILSYSFHLFIHFCSDMLVNSCQEALALLILEYRHISPWFAGVTSDISALMVPRKIICLFVVSIRKKRSLKGNGDFL